MTKEVYLNKERNKLMTNSHYQAIDKKSLIKEANDLAIYMTQIKIDMETKK